MRFRIFLSAFFFLSYLNGNCAVIERGPYLEDMSEKSVVIRYRTDIPTSSWLTYGVYPDCDRFSTVSRIVKEHKVNLNGLLPDTTHCYRIYLPVLGSTNSYKADEAVFKTFPDEKATSFSFLSFGDSGSNSEPQKKIAEMMSKFSNVYFTLHTGDLVDSGLDADANSQYFKMYGEMLKKIPFYIALGNHDYGKDFNSEETKNFLKENFTLYHNCPLNGLCPHYYYFDIANARFIILDSNRFYGINSAPELTKGSAQYLWLEKVLKNTNKTWKFIVLHEPVYSSGEHGIIEDENNTLAPLFEKYGVDIVFQGHDHNYERTKPIKENLPDETGVIYITLGGGGRDLYTKGDDNDWSEVFILKHHFAYVTIEDKKLIFNVYDMNGELIDKFSKEK